MFDDFPHCEVLDRARPESHILTKASAPYLRSVTAYGFHSADHLDAYAGIAPVTRRSGSSIRGEFPTRSGNKRLKNALFYSTFAAIRSHEPSRQYYERKRAEGKRHNTAVICLA
ncbi:transposase [Corynebacterium hindlerae]|uniref:transposase n=1 Tax=Corynebacterium hindlerae TaxID=699041 RepID=UPI003AAA89D1